MNFLGQMQGGMHTGIPFASTLYLDYLSYMVFIPANGNANVCNLTPVEKNCISSWFQLNVRLLLAQLYSSCRFTDTDNMSILSEL